jgi:hypothetical protein
MNDQSIVDGYLQFFKIIPKENFFEFGINNIISIDIGKAKMEWGNLLGRIKSKSNDLFVRNSGRNGSGNQLLSELYKSVFEIDIKYDQTNNDQPSRLIQNLTGYRKNKTIRNYQVSHVFGNTKNVFCFTAPWNIVFIPKIIDPLTGHEAKGDFVEEFKDTFQKTILTKFEDQIKEYNDLMEFWHQKISSWIEKNIDTKNHNSIIKDFSKIGF